MTDTYTYDAFGLLLQRTGSTENDYMYTGEQYDPNVGFYYLRARYYNPEIGRFTTVDPWKGSIYDPASLHKYAYCYNDPIDCVDWSGALTQLEMAVTLAIVMPLLTIIVIHYFALGSNDKITDFSEEDMEALLYALGIEIIGPFISYGGVIGVAVFAAIAAAGANMIWNHRENEAKRQAEEAEAREQQLQFEQQLRLESDQEFERQMEIWRKIIKSKR